MNLYLKNILWVYLGTFLVLPITYLIRVIYAQNLTISDYGLFYGLFGVFGFFEFLRNWGINNASVYFVNKFLVEKDYQKIKSIFYFNHIVQVVLSIIIGVALFISRDFIFNHFYEGEINIEPIFNIFILYWIVQTIFETNKKYLDIFQNQKVNTFFNILLFSSILVISGGFIFQNSMPIHKIPASAYLMAYGFVSIISLIYILYKYKKFLIKPCLHFSKKFFKDIFTYSNALIVAGLAGTIFIATDTIIIQYFEGAKDVAFYATAHSTALLLTVLSVPISQVTTPLITKLWHSSEKKEIEKIISFILNNYIILLLPVVVLFFLFAENIINTIYGDKFLPSVLLLKLLSIGMVFFCMNIIIVPMLNAMGKPKESSKLTVIVGVFNFIGNLIIVNFLGVKGIVIMTVLSYFFTNIIALKIISSEVKVRFEIKTIAKIVFSVAIFGFLSLILKKHIYHIYTEIKTLNVLINFMIIFAFSGVAYTISLFATKVIQEEKIEYFKKLIFQKQVQNSK